jgi:23S rRNA pseudouridine2605 synthase
VYLAKVRNVPDAATFERMRKGVTVDGERMAVDRVRLVESDKNSWVELTLHEGKHHEVRRLLEAVGHPVSKLRRVSVGPVSVKGLEPGEYRSLTPQEVAGLLKPPSKRPAPKPERPFVRRGSGPRGRVAGPDRGVVRPPVGGRKPEGRGHGTSASRGGHPNRPSAGRGSSSDRDWSAERGSSSGRGSTGDRGGSSTGDGSSSGRGSSAGRDWSAERRSSSVRGSSAGRGSATGRGSSAGRGRKPPEGRGGGADKPSGRGSDKAGRRGRSRG